jgi:hypothetical protein
VIVYNKRGGQIVGPRPAKGGGAYVFQPGANDVPEEYLKGLDEHGIAALDSYFEEGWLDAELPEENDAPAPVASEPTSGDQLPEDAEVAIAKVKASKDRKELAGWLEHEQRENVFEALVDALNALDGGSSLKA